jgi:predicted AlkP superfamily pyrophosphatase or phosphodiesterase
MQASHVRRVVLVVMDALRPDAIIHFDMERLLRLVHRGASTLSATTIQPSVTAAAMTSLFTGVPPQVHGLKSDRFHIPKSRSCVEPMPALLAGADYRTTTFIAEVPIMLRGLCTRVARQLGVGDARFVGRDAQSIALAARHTLATQRRGLILLHWPDADNAGHQFGWMSPQYADATAKMDRALAMIGAEELAADPSTLFIVCADHGGGGVVATNHDSDHPLDTTIPIVLTGGAVVPGTLAAGASLLDIPATILWALGVERPPTYAGRVLSEAFAASRVHAPAVA